jgi:hypothetical protein
MGIFRPPAARQTASRVGNNVRRIAGSHHLVTHAVEIGHLKGQALVERARSSTRDWRTGVSHAIHALLEFLASEPYFTRLAFVDAPLAGPEMTRRTHEHAGAYARLLLDGAPQRRRPPRSPPKQRSTRSSSSPSTTPRNTRPPSCRASRARRPTSRWRRSWESPTPRKRQRHKARPPKPALPLPARHGSGTTWIPNMLAASSSVASSMGNVERTGRPCSPEGPNSATPISVAVGWLRRK